MSDTLIRQSVSVRDSTRSTGRRVMQGFVSNGLAVIPHEIVDELNTDNAKARWIDGGRVGAQPGPQLIRGFILVHAHSGYVLTPVGWILPTREVAATCVRRLVNKFGGLFEGGASDIQSLSSAVCKVQREAGALTGRHHHLRQMDALFDEDEYQRKLAELRASKQPAHHGVAAFQEAAE
ncbi:hypothetical protein OIV19_12075 [Brucella sp. HL-2]|nr:hypothetical protein [Brucella sp. HL-2]MCV9908350.1 hypothetical protein [Brucella sp. HL-2]